MSGTRMKPRQWKRAVGFGILESTRALGGVLGILAVLTLVAGCDGDTDTDTSTTDTSTETVTYDGPPQDLSATQIEIDASFDVTPARVPAYKAQETKLQWHNGSTESILLVFVGSGTGLVIPAGQYSQVWQVNPDADVNTDGSLRPYEYKLKKTSGGAPLEGTAPGAPAVDVGP